MLRTLFLLAFAGLVWCSVVWYEVPEPSIEVFSPKGFRISIQDSRSVEQVEFTVTVPGTSEPLLHKAYKPNRGYWSYWNSDVVVHLCDKIRYKLVVKYLDMYCTREGVYIVQRVVGNNETDCEEECGDHGVMGGFLGSDDFDRNMGKFATGKSSNFQSSYSMYKEGGMKPITKSSTSTTAGHFYLNPSGGMEGSGYKSGSTFDSTKNEGEQWHHYRSELTKEELEEMRKSGFRGLDLAGKFFAGSLDNYDFKNFPDRTGISGGEVNTQFHETHRTHESSSFSQSKPTVHFQFDDLSMGGQSRDGKSQTSTNKFELGNQVTNPQPQTGGYYNSRGYHEEKYREEHSMPGTKVHVGREPNPQKPFQGPHTKEYSSSHGQQATSESRHYNQREFNSGKATTIENRRDHVSHAYEGTIFKYYRSSRPRYPEECVLVPGTDYTASENFRYVEKVLYELSCLSSLSETSTRKELETLKQKNIDLNRRIELLERKFSHFESSCKCH